MGARRAAEETIMNVKERCIGVPVTPGTPRGGRAMTTAAPIQGPRARVEARPVRVLVAVANDATSGNALQRGDVLARALGAELYVLHVLPPRRWLHGIVGRGRRGAAAERSEEMLAAGDATLRFCELMLARPFSPQRILTRRGDVAETVEEVAQQLDAALLALGGSAGAGSGRRGSRGTVAKILRRSTRPVLVARASTRSDAIVAATDFSDWSFPALTRAAEIGGRLQAPLTFVHNVDPLAALIAGSAFGAPAMVLGASLHDAERRREEHLRYVASTLGRHIDTVVTCRKEASDAILDVARERDADMIVVGAHRRRGLRDLAGRGTAETVAAAARRSVLAVPMAPAEAAAA